MMKVLVTGGNGFIGSHLAEHYYIQGADVSILDNFSRSNLYETPNWDSTLNWKYLKKRCPKIQMLNEDVRNVTRMMDVSQGVDVIIHTAAQVAVTTSLVSPITDFEINARGSLNILEAARKNDAAVLFCSTNKVYGENINQIPTHETDTRYHYSDTRYKRGIPESFSIDHSGHSPYGCSKLSADIYMQDYAHTYDLKTCVFRLSCIYGERQLGIEDQGWVAWFTTATILGKPITIFGDGKQVRDILYIQDLVNAFDAFLDSGIKHDVFNIGGGADNTISLLELIDLLTMKTGISPNLSFSNWRSGDQKVYISDISKAKEKLNWEPETSLNNGIDRLVNWVLDNKPIFEI
jgi:CDP-paratose 2-epimerase|tara:strand:+ start:1295 stop:2341 length:1047 start_codon:yes stop_codon:yes gene_type:complete